MSTNLGEDKVSSLLLRLSIPAIFGMLSSAIYNIVDRVFVGRLDPLALTGVGITMPLQILQMAFVLLIGIGSSTLISIKLGEGKLEDAEGILLAALKYIFISLTLFTIPVVIFIEDILILLSVSPDVMGFAKDYIVILMLGGIFGLPGFCLNNSLRSIGFAKTSMKIIVFSSILNIILDPIFIFTLGLGIKGAAIATAISQIYVTIAVLYFFIKREDSPIRLRLKRRGASLGYLKEIISNGSPTFYMQILGTAVSVMINTSILKYGSDMHLAGFTIIGSIYSFYHMIIIGVVQGNQPICGYNFGAKKFHRVKESLYLTLKVTLFLSVIMLIWIMTLPHSLARMFTDDIALINITSRFMRIYLLALPAAGLHTVVAQYFQAVSKPNLSTVLLVLRYGGILIPSLMVLPLFWGIEGVFFSNVVSDSISFLVAWILVAREAKSYD